MRAPGSCSSRSIIFRLRLPSLEEGGPPHMAAPPDDAAENRLVSDSEDNEVRDETSLCAKLQWVTNYALLCDGSLPRATGGRFWGVEHVGSETLGVTRFAVFDDDARRILVFRGYSCGTWLPLPIPSWPRINGETVRVNRIPYESWRAAEPTIRRWCARRGERELVLCGYSIGTAPALLTAAADGTDPDRIYLLSPFPFCGRALFKHVRAPMTQVWLEGDRLTRCYAPLYSIAPRGRRPTRSPIAYRSVFGYHNTMAIALALASDRDELRQEMNDILQRLH